MVGERSTNYRCPRMNGGPRVSICEWTTFPASFGEELAAYREAGADGIGLLEFKLPEGDVLGKLRASGLVATNCLPAAGSILPSPLIPGPEEPAARMASICESLHRLAELEPTSVFFLTGPGPERRDEVVAGVRRIAEEADRAGVRAVLEPIHPSQADVLSFISSLDEAVALLDKAEADLVGLLFDTWQLWDSPGLGEQIRRHAGRIGGVHVGDRREPTRGHFDRALPGDGVIPLGSVIRMLDEAGYDGYYDVEIFSDNGIFGDHHPDSLWDLEPREAARRAVDSFMRVWEER